MTICRVFDHSITLLGCSLCNVSRRVEEIYMLVKQMMATLRDNPCSHTHERYVTCLKPTGPDAACVIISAVQIPDGNRCLTLAFVPY